MIYGVIDIGSNSIRLSIYKYEKEKLKLLMTKKATAGLASYVTEGQISYKGIERACHILSEFKMIIENFNISEVYAFATASLRNISNDREAAKIIVNVTGFSVELLSGEEEARLDFKGAIHNSELEKGLLVDIGGGSTEFVSFEDKGITNAMSIPIGSLNLYLKYIKGLLPNSAGISEIETYVRGELKKSVLFEGHNHEIICGVGGTIRAIRKLYNDVYELSNDNNEMESGKLKHLLQLFKREENDLIRRILQLTPERIHTIIPGMIHLCVIININKAAKIIVSKQGLREGYIYDRILRL